MRERRGQKVRIDLNGTDLRLIKPGLDLAVKRQKAALNEQGLQPGRGYNKRFAKMVRDLNGTLPHHKGGDFYFDATEISALRFALSETRRKLLRDKTAQRGKQERPLVRQLEMVAEKLQQVRKCAEREAIKTSGKAAYDKRRQRWKAFKVWLGAATNQKKKQRKRPEPLTEVASAQLDTATVSPQRLKWHRWQDLMREAITERMTIEVSESSLKYLVGRLRERIRRSDDNISPDDAFENPEKAKEYAFEFLKKRPRFEGKIKLGFGWADLASEQSARGDKFRRATIIEPDEGDISKTHAPAGIRNSTLNTSKEKRLLKSVDSSSGAHTNTAAINNPTGDLQQQAVVHQQSLCATPRSQDPAATRSRPAPSTMSAPRVHVKPISQSDAFPKTAPETTQHSTLPQESCEQTTVLPEHANRPPAPEKITAGGALNVPQPVDSDFNSKICPTTKSPPLVPSPESDAAHEQGVSIKEVSRDSIIAAVADWLEGQVNGPTDGWYVVIDSAKQIAKGLPVSFERTPVRALPEPTFQQVLADNRPAGGSGLIPGQTDYFSKWIVTSLMTVVDTKNEVLGFLNSGLNQAMQRQRERELLSYKNRVRYI